MSTRLSAYSSLLGAALIWGAANPIIKHTLGDIPPVLFLTYRLGISAFLGLLFFIVYPQELPKHLKQWVHVVIFSLLGSVLGLGFFFWGMTYTSSVTGSLISSVSPLFITIAGVLFLKEHASRGEKIGIGLALLGTAITVLGSNGSSQSVAHFPILGNSLIILACLSGALGEVYVKLSIRDHVSPASITHLSFMIGFICFSAITALLYTPQQVFTIITTLPLTSHLGILYMAVLSGTLAYYLYNRAMKTLPIGEASIFSYLAPLFAIPLSILWLHEHISLPYLIGAGIICLGVVVSEFKKRKERRARPSQTPAGLVRTGSRVRNRRRGKLGLHR